MAAKNFQRDSNTIVDDEAMGLAFRECWTRSMRIQSGLSKSNCVYTGNCSCTFASVLLVAFVTCAYVHLHASCCFKPTVDTAI